MDDNPKINLAQLMSDVAESLSYQRAIYFLLTKDLPASERQKLDLQRKADYQNTMLRFLTLPFEDQSASPAFQKLKQALAETEKELSELDSQGKESE